MYKSDDRKLDDDVFLSRVLCSVKKCQEMSERQSEINAPRNAWMSMIWSTYIMARNGGASYWMTSTQRKVDAKYWLPCCQLEQAYGKSSFLNDMSCFKQDYDWKFGWNNGLQTKGNGDGDVFLLGKLFWLRYEVSSRNQPSISSLPSMWWLQIQCIEPYCTQPTWISGEVRRKK